MMKYSVRHLLLSAVAMAGIHAAQAAEGPPVEALVAPCAACHGPKGVSSNPAMPTLAGMDPEYFVDDMLAFKHGEIESPMMKPFSQGSREQFEAMAEYYARQDYVPQEQEFDPEKAKRGAELHEEYCGICHRDGGSNDAAREWNMAPLAGQGEAYLRTTFEAFANGSRAMTDGKEGWVNALMRDHGKEGLDALMNYYASQQ